MAKKLGCTPANISSWERGKSKIDIDSFAELCLIYHLDFAKTLEQLSASDNSENYHLTTSEHEHIKKYRTLDEYGKKAVSGLLDIEYERCTSESKIVDISIELPIAEQPASAGTGNWLEDGYSTRVKVLDTPQSRRANIIIKVSGDSMEPMFCDGDTVLVKIQPDIEPGEIGIFIVDNEGYIKKMGDHELISINPEYDNIPIGKYTDFRCFGKVIGRAQIVEQ